MLQPSYTNQFQKDWKRLRKKGKSKEKLKKVLGILIHEKQLPKRCRDHKITGNYKGRRECHIDPDWLLIYKTIESEIIFERTGSHSDLFQ
jgi:mRNA interferase YafQ